MRNVRGFDAPAGRIRAIGRAIQLSELVSTGDK
jgi:hypothetical protein